MVSSQHEHHDYVVHRKFTRPVDKNEVFTNWQLRGFTTNEVLQPSGSMLAKAVENKDELVVVAEGSLECRVGAEAQLVFLHEGDELFIPRFTPFEAQVPDNVDHILLYIGLE